MKKPPSKQQLTELRAKARALDQIIDVLVADHEWNSETMDRVVDCIDPWTATGPDGYMARRIP